MTEREPRLAILLVEDNPGDARLVVELLREATIEHTVRHVASMAAAVPLLEETDFDVVLLDLSLPDGVGLPTVQRVRGAAPNVPIVVLTGLDDGGLALEAVAAGAQDYLIKTGVDGTALERALRHSIGRHRHAARIAYYDSLTSLPNRSLFEDRFKQALTRSRRYGDNGALLFVDLDGFKNVNDSLGHDAGDRILRLVAQRMREAVRASDVVARLGGDEFAVLLPCLIDREEARIVAEKLRVAIGLAHDVADGPAIRASVGIALFPGDGGEYAALLQAADEAMYRAKKAGKDRVAFASEPAQPEAMW